MNFDVAVQRCATISAPLLHLIPHCTSAFAGTGMYQDSRNLPGIPGARSQIFRMEPRSGHGSGKVLPGAGIPGNLVKINSDKV